MRRDEPIAQVASEVMLPRIPNAAKQEKDWAAQNGPMTTTVDLSCFKFFDAKSAFVKPQLPDYVSVSCSNRVTVFCDKFSEGDKVAIGFNSIGTIVAVKKVDSDGLRLNKHKSKSSLVTQCAPIGKMLKELNNIELPCRYAGSWDDKAGAWVGRLQQKEKAAK